MALGQRQPAASLLLPTARGRPYGADSYRQRLTPHGIQPSMRRKGDGGDNAGAESCCHSLKTAGISLEDVDTHEYAPTAVFEDSEGFGNRQRGHAAKGYLAPLAYEQVLQTHEMLCPEKC